MTPLYLYWKAKHHGFSSKFIKLSADTNSSMPYYAVERLKSILRKKGKPLTKAKVLLIGVTYKRDVKDLRKSPPLTVIEILQKKKVKVSYYDPIIPYLDFGSIDLKSIQLTKNTLSKFDCVLITADHTKVNYDLILKNARLIYDIKNIYGNRDDKKIIRF